MKNVVSPLLIIGLIVYISYAIINRFIMPLADIVAIPVLLVTSLLIIVGVYRTLRRYITKQSQ